MSIFYSGSSQHEKVPNKWLLRRFRPKSGSNLSESPPVSVLLSLATYSYCQFQLSSVLVAASFSGVQFGTFAQLAVSVWTLQTS